MYEVLERLRALERARVGHEHPADRPVVLGHGEDRPHAVGHEPLERVAGFRHDVVLEQAAQAEDAHIVIPHEIGGDLEGVARLGAHAMGHACGAAPRGKELTRRSDVSRGLLMPLPAQVRGRDIDPHAHRPGARPVEPQRVGDREADKFGGS